MTLGIVHPAHDLDLVAAASDKLVRHVITVRPGHVSLTDRLLQGVSVLATSHVSDDFAVAVDRLQPPDWYLLEVIVDQVCSLLVH